MPPIYCRHREARPGLSRSWAAFFQAVARFHLRPCSNSRGCDADRQVDRRSERECSPLVLLLLLRKAVKPKLGHRVRQAATHHSQVHVAVPEIVDPVQVLEVRFEDVVGQVPAQGDESLPFRRCVVGDE